MITLGLDLGGHFGFAVGSGGRIIECGVANLERRATQLRASKHSALWKFLREKIEQHGVQVVAWENSVAAMAGSSAGVRKGRGSKEFGLTKGLILHAGYEAIVRVISEIKGLRILDPVANMTLKKFATDFGHADKSQMIHAAHMLYGVRLRNDEGDAADACHVCGWAMQQLKTAARTG